MGFKSRRLTYTALRKKAIPNDSIYSSSTRGTISNHDQVRLTPLIRANTTTTTKLMPKLIMALMDEAMTITYFEK